MADGFGREAKKKGAPCGAPLIVFGKLPEGKLTG
jgi:hypothetical protein